MLIRTLLLSLTCLSHFVVLCQQSDSLSFQRYYYEGGALSSEGYLKDGKPEGYWKSYYRNGNLKTEGNRVNYALDGVWKFYAEDGHKTFEITYSKGKKDGWRRSYNEEGKLMREEPFVRDSIQGMAREYYPELEKVRREVPYVDNLRSGVGYAYNEEGRIVSLLTYKANVLVKEQQINRTDGAGQKQGLWIDFYPTKRIKVEGPYINDLRNGYWKYYQPNGNLIKVEKWVMGELVENAGEVAKIEVKREFHPGTNTLSYRGTYRNGVEEGVHREYNEEGEVIASTIYVDGVVLYEGIVDENGRKQGLWKEYYEDGSLKAEGKYRDDRKVEKWKYYYRSGQLEQEGTYIRGLPDGEWNWFYTNGQLWRSEEFVGGLEEGKSVEYNDTGAVIAEGQYIEGLKDGDWMLRINDYREQGPYFEGLRNGLWKHYYLQNDQLMFEGRFENGLPNDFHVWYYPNGQIKKRGNYLSGTKDGVWEYYNEDGSTVITIEYQDGEEVRYNGEKITYGRRLDKLLESE